MDHIMIFLYPLAWQLLQIAVVNAGQMKGIPQNESNQNPIMVDAKKIYLIDGISLPRGKVTEFSAVINTVIGKPAKFRFQIYRATDAHNVDYYLIGEKVVSALNLNLMGVYQYKMAAGEEILTEDGDRLGLLNEEEFMCIRWKVDSIDEYHVRFAKFTSIPNVNDTIHFQKVTVPQAFGITVLIESRVVATPSVLGITGATGVPGKTGSPGLPGPQGMTGQTGPMGQKGDRGPKGNTGVKGNIGLPGPKGLRGQQGNVGNIGLPGNVGARGPTGPKGSTGIKGVKGRVGLNGPSGLKGSRGIKGSTGMAGMKGQNGPKGDAGLTGGTGPYGSTGVPGVTGSTGVIGPVGMTGRTGPAGMTGPMGSTGIPFMDKDECALNQHGCNHFCVNTLGSFKCICRPGHNLLNDNATCVDIDECLTRNGDCQHSCLNEVGSFRCHCQTGYKLGPDRTSCLDVNECNVNNGDCTEQQNCVNTNGGMHCIVKGNTNIGSQTAGVASAQANCETGLGLLSRNTLVGFIVWLIILSLIVLVILICLFIRRGRRKVEKYYHDDASRQQYSESGWDERSQKQGSRLPDVQYY